MRELTSLALYSVPFHRLRAMSSTGCSLLVLCHGSSKHLDSKKAKWLFLMGKTSQYTVNWDPPTQSSFIRWSRLV